MTSAAIILAEAAASLLVGQGPVVGTKWQCVHSFPSDAYRLNFVVQPNKNSSAGDVIVIASSGDIPAGTVVPGMYDIERLEAFDQSKADRDENYLTSEFRHVFASSLVSFSMTWRARDREISLSARTMKKVYDSDRPSGYKYIDLARSEYTCERDVT